MLIGQGLVPGDPYLPSMHVIMKSGRIGSFFR